ncbi:MAG: hypothetical protein LBT83_07945 [Tannerella sp.]|jgi:hypothetical protein|nr:hypothetical protein [Tannerella sp.]
MKTIDYKQPKKSDATKRKNSASVNEKKPLSAIARFWETIDSKDGEIIDMRAVLK